ncbi:DUF4157 domain-containing protein [Deinococcus sp. JMULE3]|uniref:eCIS core domain-containing protein n=1 Tax=Deinococcus sp. JMULE3 TaxID=2518341 RepID=UPI0015769CDA|nr:DUF4157 domain-containing protein [Deinococcus sp. JMULE3]
MPAPLLPLSAPLLPLSADPLPGQTMVDRPASAAPTLSGPSRSTVAGAFPVVTAPRPPIPPAAPAPALENSPAVQRGLPPVGNGPVRTSPFTGAQEAAAQDVAGDLPERIGGPPAAGLPGVPHVPEVASPDDSTRTLLTHATRTPGVSPVTSRPAHAVTPDLRGSAVQPVYPGAPLLSPAASRRAAPGPQLKAAPAGRTRTGTDQAVLAALEHALARDGHGAPLSPGEQVALRGVLGTSVADVRVVRRPEVTPALRAARADGLTVRETVFLPHDVPLGSAAGLALAAHEVTHARRARDPLFVPAALTRPERPQSVGRPAPADEEGVALATEHAAFAQADPTRQSRADAPRRAPGLPAPWEPLPAWDAPDLPARPSVSADAWAPAVPSVPAPDQSVSAALPAAPPPATTPLWHAAATDRAPAPAAKPARPPEDQAVGRRAQPRSSVDLDQVAREVYARLRERLSQELRRLN